MIETSRLTIGKNLYTGRMSKLAKSFVISLPILAFSLISILGYPAHAFGSEFELSKWFDKALAINQNNVPALVQKGTELVNQGDGEQAVLHGNPRWREGGNWFQSMLPPRRSWVKCAETTGLA